MTTLTEIRTRLRQELHDTASSRWDDDVLDRHIGHALEELSRAMPREVIAQLPTTVGSRELSLATLENLIDVERVEFPAGCYPPAVVSFQRWGDRVIFDAPQTPSGGDALVRYTVGHTLDDETSTLSLFQEELVALGASGFAVTELSAASIDTITTGGQAVPADFNAWAQARLIAFHQLLHQYGRRPPLRTRRPTVAH
jgi:hypothetical protein